jgi:REP-associated tyrosine transposase
MPRRPRNQLPPAGVYHVTARGVDRGLIVRDEFDWRSLQELVVTAQRRFEWTCDAYCLMSTHFHLLAQTTLPDLSRGMHWLNGTYALRFNRRWGRVGHLFQSRFDAWVIRDERHWERACRYILDNPVKAGLCEFAADWPWSGGRVARR